MGSKVQTEWGNAAGETLLPECWTQCVLSVLLLKGGFLLIGTLPSAGLDKKCKVYRVLSFREPCVFLLCEGRRSLELEKGKNNLC